MQTDRFGNLYCSECDFEAAGDFSWRKHVDDEHDGVDPRIARWVCPSPWCHKEFFDTAVMAKHIEESHLSRVLLPPNFDLEELAKEAQAQLAFADWCRENGRG